MKIHDDVELEDMPVTEEEGTIEKVLRAVDAEKPKRTPKTYLRLIPANLHGLVKRASASTGIDTEELAELAITDTLATTAGLAQSLLKVAQDAHLRKQAAVEEELIAAAQEVSHA